VITGPLIVNAASGEGEGEGVHVTLPRMNELSVDRKDDGVVLITLNRPDMRNAMTDTMTAEWRETMTGLATDRDARCLIVTGAGTAFSSGGDLSWIGERGAEAVPPLRERMLAFYRTWLMITELEIPTVAAVNGPAVGAGLCVALACDLVYAADDAKLLAPFTSLGLHPGMAATYLLPRRAPGLAREMLLAGRTVSGKEAADKGLVNQSFPKNDLMSEVTGIATKIAQNAPIATRLTKVALGQGHQDLEAALRWESLAQPVTMASADMIEGLSAHRERRMPKFTGS
jgi:enoyl-CoA hydratase